MSVYRKRRTTRKATAVVVPVVEWAVVYPKHRTTKMAMEKTVLWAVRLAVVERICPGHRTTKRTAGLQAAGEPEAVAVPVRAA